jgi:hypothetical protein
MLVKDLSFWPRWQALICTDHISGFMWTGKSSSLVTTLSNRTPALWLLVGGIMKHQDDGRVEYR